MLPFKFFVKNPTNERVKVYLCEGCNNYGIVVSGDGETLDPCIFCKTKCERCCNNFSRIENVHDKDGNDVYIPLEVPDYYFNVYVASIDLRTQKAGKLIFDVTWKCDICNTTRQVRETIDYDGINWP